MDRSYIDPTKLFRLSQVKLLDRADLRAIRQGVPVVPG
jgi:hypothetical protein